MLYKPKYCCNCGEKIERAHWNLKTSRRFCELCETDYVLEDWTPRLAAVLVIVFGAVGVAGFLRNAGPAADDQKYPVRTASQSNKATQSAVFTQVGPSSNVNDQGVRKVGLPATVKPADPPASADEDKHYFCGAETKKGTPCSRRVKMGTRCWQHIGQPAMTRNPETIRGK